MASNSFNLNNNKADIVITDGTNTVGMQYLEKTTLVESRGTAFAGNTNSGGTTYQDATPFKRKVWDTWIGGLGQAQENTTYGGTGAGGDPTKFLDADAHTRRTGYLFPGLARNLVYNTVNTAVKTPIADGLNPNAGDEQEVPRGVVPANLPVDYFNSTNYLSNSFTTTASGPTINNIRVLIQSPDYQAGWQVLTEIRTTGGSLQATFSYTITTPDAFTGWKWAACTFNSGTATLLANTTYNIRVYSTSAITPLVVGCYIGTSNAILPYFQLNTSATPFKYWANPVIKVEQIDNGSGTYANIAMHSTGLFNTGAIGTAGSAATSPERLYTSGTYRGSIWYNSKLYVSTNTGTAAWDYTAASTNAAPTNALDVTGAFSAGVEFGGKLYLVGAAGNIIRWDGTFPIAIGTNWNIIMSSNVIGGTGTSINALFILGGFLYVIKPEGIYQIFREPGKIDTTEVPPVDKLVAFPTKLTSTGKWWTIHQNMLFCNYKDQVWQIAFSGTNGVQINVLKPDFPRYRLNYYHYVNGITSDGRNVYASWNNLGVFSYVGASWHKEMEHYEIVATEGQSSGLTWLPNPTSAPDYLFCGDGRTLVQLPNPNAYGPYTNQLYANHFNKCGWLMTSAWDGDLAEIVKYIQSAVLRALPGIYWCFKLSATMLQANVGASASSILEKTWQQGLVRDSWTSPNYPTVITPRNVVTNLIDFSTGLPTPNTLAPTCWGYGDLDNIYISSEKLAVPTSDTTTNPDTTRILTDPSKVVQTTFILYFWNPTPGQAATVGQEVMSVDSLSIKYQPIQDYIPVYQCTIDVDSLIMEQTSAETNANVNAAVTQVRAWAGRHSPVRAQFYTSEGIKSVNCFIQDARFEYDPVAGGFGIEPLPKRIFMTLIGTDPEYQGT